MVIDIYKIFFLFSVCGGRKKQKIMYKSAKNAGKWGVIISEQCTESFTVIREL